MKRIWIYIIGIVLILAAIAAVLVVMGDAKDHSAKPNTDSTASVDHSTAFPKRQACTIFTLADAKQVLGNTAKGGAGTGNTSSDELEVSDCSYAQDSGANAAVSSGKSATLLVRAPKSGAGTTSNQNQFGPLKPSDAQQVTGYGDNAYWDAQYGQLNILKNNTWYILSYGPVTPADRTLDQTKQLADLLINKM